MGENHSLLIGEATACSARRGKQFALLMHFGFLLAGVVGTLLGPDSADAGGEMAGW